ANAALEADGVAAFVAAETVKHGLQPRDFVLLVRQRAANYMELLEAAFAEQGMRLRNEAAEIGPVRLQELLAEELSEIAVRFLRLIGTDRAGRSWTECVQSIAALRGIPIDSPECSSVGRELGEVTRALRSVWPA